MNKNSQSGYALIELAFFLLYIVGFVGWVLNIVKIVGMTGQDSIQHTGILIFRVFGLVFFPVGCVLGFL